VYPHEPAVLYRSARELGTTPLIRYWTYYQVLEYFFPRYSLEEARRTASHILVDPRFDPHREEDVSRLLDSLGQATGRNRTTEEKDLATTLNAIVTESEIRQYIDDSGLEDLLRSKDSEVSDKRIILAGNEPTRGSVAARIYDIRCRIVHSKSDGGSGGTGLLPGTYHEDLVLRELPLIEFLAQRALIASAERSDFAPRRTVSA